MLKNHETYTNQGLNNAVLLLENGDIFWGQGIGPKKYSIGELCFNTSQTGYQEILTDPSYAGQIITFTFPHIGIVGANKIDNESDKVHALGCIINQRLGITSSWRSNYDLENFFNKNNIICISGIDTRYLTRTLASKGAIKAAIINFNKDKSKIKKIKKQIDDWGGLKNLDLANLISTETPYKWSQGIWGIKNNNYNLFNKKNKSINIVCIDFGIKKNILRNMINNNFNVVVLPSKSSFEKIMSYKPNGIFLSNGPGDPYATSKQVVPVIKEIIKTKIPIFGICLGHQILSLALGAKTTKMFQGHRGGNHPVKNIKTQSVEITTQNHGFEVNKKSLPKNLFETHISLFDETNEGIHHRKYPFFSVQYHPEASPGPHDSHYLFKQFYTYVKKYAQKKRHK